MSQDVAIPDVPARGSASTKRLALSSVLACASCAGVVLLLEVEHRLGVQHFFGWPFFLLFALMIAATVACMVFAYRDAAHRRRGRPSPWLVVGLVPIGFWAAAGFYGAASWDRRHVPNNLLMNMARRAGATVMEAEAAWAYPNRRASRRFVMFYRELADPDADAAAMERHIEGMEAILGRPPRGHIHWVRGKLLGVGGLSLYGLALGSPSGPGAEGFGQTDRHEAAHAFLTGLVAPDSDPPTVLSEGWAQAVAFGWLTRRPEPAALAADLLKLRDAAGCPPLADFFGPGWYHQDRGLVYGIGPHLVRHLVDRYGAEKFVRLYATIRPGEAEAAFRDIYGISLDSIERSIFAEAGGAVRPERAGQDR